MLVSKRGNSRAVRLLEARSFHSRPGMTQESETGCLTIESKKATSMSSRTSEPKATQSVAQGERRSGTHTHRSSFKQRTAQKLSRATTEAWVIGPLHSQGRRIFVGLVRNSSVAATAHLALRLRKAGMSRILSWIELRTADGRP
jgi:hypothetical protein